MKIIFLDVDGVLNNLKRWELPEMVMLGGHAGALVDPLACELLVKLVQETGAKIVISSTWRHYYMQELELGLCLKFGLPRRTIIGKTPDFSGRNAPRGAEILAWLRTAGNHEATGFVILDDDANMDQVSDHLVLTTFADGLQPAHCELAKLVLARPAKYPYDDKSNRQQTYLDAL